MAARLRPACAVAATAVLALIGLADPPALASPVAQGTTAVATAASLSAVSCVSSAWCMAVGSYTARPGQSHALAQIWHGTSWQLLKPPGSLLTSVSCSDVRLCLASGGPTGTERWNGKAWRELRIPANAVTAPSCGGGPLCMVINGSSRDGSVDFAESWTGGTWRTWWQTGICFGPPGLCALNAVSCGSRSICAAVGYTQYAPQNFSTQTNSVIWTGKRWAVSHPPTPGAPAWLNAVSCTARFCMATGVGYSALEAGYLPIAARWSKTTGVWQDVSPDLGVVCAGFSGICDSWATSISCAGTATCMTIGPAGSLAWTGASWIPAPTASAGPRSGLGAVACGGTICLAVGYRRIAKAVQGTLAELWNGSGWQIISTPKVGSESRS